MSQKYIVVHIFYQGIGDDEIQICNNLEELRKVILSRFQTIAYDYCHYIEKYAYNHIYYKNEEFDEKTYMEDLEKLDTNTLKNKYINLIKCIIDNEYNSTFKDIKIIKGDIVDDVDINECFETKKIN